MTYLSANSLSPRRNRRHSTDCIRHFLEWNVLVSINISLKFIPEDPINNIPALVQIMAWRQPGNTPLSEPKMIILLTHICVTWPQWVKENVSLSFTCIFHSNFIEFVPKSPIVKKSALVRYNGFSMEILFSCNSVADINIATKFCTRHDSTSYVPCAKFCSEQLVRIWMRVKWNFHHIWIMLKKKSLVKWAPGENSSQNKKRSNFPTQSHRFETSWYLA